MASFIHIAVRSAPNCRVIWHKVFGNLPHYLHLVVMIIDVVVAAVVVDDEDVEEIAMMEAEVWCHLPIILRATKWKIKKKIMFLLGKDGNAAAAAAAGQ